MGLMVPLLFQQEWWRTNITSAKDWKKKQIALSMMTKNVNRHLSYNSTQNSMLPNYNLTFLHIKTHKPFKVQTYKWCIQQPLKTILSVLKGGQKPTRAHVACLDCVWLTWNSLGPAGSEPGCRHSGKLCSGTVPPRGQTNPIRNLVISVKKKRKNWV